MRYKELVEAIERVNAEYISLKEYESPEYILGRRILHLKKCFPFRIHRWILDFYNSQKQKKNSAGVSSYVKKEDFFYASPQEICDKKGVVYSCITGGYDKPYEPVYVSENLQYVLFTDDTKEIQDSVWKQIKIKDDLLCTGSNFANRYYKFHPFEQFGADYDFSIYIDGNVQTVSDISALYTVAQKSKIGIAMHRHASRSCAYKDAKWCEYNKRGNLKFILNQMEKYRSEGFPENFGLCEATIIVVDMHNEKAKEILNLWWSEFCSSESRRDQLSFPYVLWKNGYKIDDVGCLGNDEYHNPKFRINAHKGKLE